MVLSANDDFNKRELSIGELETAAGGFFGLLPTLPPPSLLSSVLNLHPHPHPHHPLPPLKDILNDISPTFGIGPIGFM
jgi:hypothetical protein